MFVIIIVIVIVIVVIIIIIIIIISRKCRYSPPCTPWPPPYYFNVEASICCGFLFQHVVDFDFNAEISICCGFLFQHIADFDFNVDTSICCGFYFNILRISISKLNQASAIFCKLAASRS